MAIVLHASASQPNDNGTYTTSPLVITPPTQMQAGDLVFVTVCLGRTSGTLSVSASGGQTWTSLTQRNQSYNRTRSFWCIFNGTWSANPSFVTSSGYNGIGRMLVFRPDNGTASTWVVDAAESSATYAAPAASPYTVTIPAVSTATPGALVIAAWTSRDDNTWGSLTSGWTVLSPAQIRNTSGTYQQSVTNAYKIQESAGSTGSVSQNQASNGGDAGTYIIIAFREVTSATPAPYVLIASAEMTETVEYGEAVKTPDAIEMSGQVVTNDFSIGTTVVEEAILGAFSVVEPSGASSIFPTPDPVGAEFSVLDEVVLYGAALQVPTPIAAASAQPVPSVEAEGLVEVGDAVDGVFDLGVPVPRVGLHPIPDVLEAVADQPEPVVLAEAVVALDAVVLESAVAATPETSVEAIGVVAEVSAEASQLTLAAVGPSTGAVSVTPEPVEAVAEQPELSLFARALIFIETAITGLFTPLAPAMAGAVIFVPDHIEIVAECLEPTGYGGALITPEPIVAEASTVDVVLEGQVAVSPEPIVGTFSPATDAAIVADTTAVVAEVSATAELVAPLIQGAGSMELYPDPIDALVDQPDPDISLGHTFEVGPVVGAFAVVEPVVDRTENPVVEVEPIGAELDQPENAFRIWHREVVSEAIAAESSLLTPIVRPQNIVTRQDWPIPGYYEMPVPSLSISSAPILIPAPLDVEASQPEPTVRARALVTLDHITGTLEQVDPNIGTAGNVTVNVAAIVGALGIVDGVETGEAFIEVEPVDGTGEALDPAVGTELETAVPADVIDAALELAEAAVTAEALIEPEPVDGEAGVLGHVVVAAALHAPDALEVTGEAVEPTLEVAGNLTVRPAILTGVLDVAADADVVVDAIVVPAPIDGAFDQPDPLVWMLSVTVEPEPVEGEFSQPTPSTAAGVTTTFGADPLEAYLSVASTPEVSISPTAVVAEIYAEASQPLTNLSGNVSVVPSPITGEFSTQTPLINSAIIGVTVAPAPIVAEWLLPYGFDWSIDAELVPVETDAVADQPSPTVALTNSPVVTPEPIAALAFVGVPTLAIDGGLLVAADHIGGTFTAVDPVVGREHTVSPDAVGGEFSLVAPYVAHGDVASVTAEPDAVDGQGSLAEPSVATTTSVTVSLSPVDAVASQRTPVVRCPCLVAVYLPVIAEASTGDALTLVNSARVVPSPLVGALTLHDATTVAISPAGTSANVAESPGRNRFVDVYGETRIKDAPPRARIVDVYLWRK